MHVAGQNTDLIAVAIAFQQTIHQVLDHAGGPTHGLGWVESVHEQDPLPRWCGGRARAYPVGLCNAAVQDVAEGWRERTR